MPIRSQAVPLAAATPLALAACLFLASTASAQNRPYYIGISQGFTHETNVFKAPSGQETSDTISSTGVLAGVNLELGRQRLYADLTANSNKHDKLSLLDNTSYSLSSGLDWQTIEHLSGSLRFSANESLGDYGILGSTPVKNVRTMRQANAAVRYGFASQLGLEAGADKRTLRYTATTEYDLDVEAANVGLRWGTPGSVLTAAIAARATQGERPRYRALLNPLFPLLGYGPVTPDEFERRDLDFSAVWVPSALSTVTGRISLTREDHSVTTLSDVSGVTGAVDWEYKPTAKLVTKASVIRDTGVQTSFIAPLGAELDPLRSEYDRINTIFALNAKYELTAKIGLSAGLRHTRGVLTDASGRSHRDSASQYTAGASYQPLRSVSLACNFTRNTQARYDADSFGCSASFVLR